MGKLGQENSENLVQSIQETVANFISPLSASQTQAAFNAIQENIGLKVSKNLSDTNLLSNVFKQNVKEKLRMEFENTIKNLPQEVQVKFPPKKWMVGKNNFLPQNSNKFIFKTPQLSAPKKLAAQKLYQAFLETKYLNAEFPFSVADSLQSLVDNLFASPQVVSWATYQLSQEKNITEESALPMAKKMTLETALNYNEYISFRETPHLASRDFNFIREILKEITTKVQ